MASDADPNAPDENPQLPDAAVNEEGPSIAIIEPLTPAPGVLTAESIVTKAFLNVQCRAEANPDSMMAVDVATVRISATTTSGFSFEASAYPTTTVNVYEATVDLSSFPNGEIEIRCTARDLGEDAIENSEAIATFIDLGPTLELLKPTDGDLYSGSLSVEFNVIPAPVAIGDSDAATIRENVHLQIAGDNLSSLLEETVSTDSMKTTYRADVSFQAPALSTPLDGQQTLVIRVTNQRGVSRKSSIVFSADGNGPTIAAVTPTEGELVGGIISIEVNVSDPAGVSPGSVVATINGGQAQVGDPIDVNLAAISGTTFKGTFDTRGLDLGIIFPNVVIRAKDIFGNESSIGYLIALDNVPPVLSLDPPVLREASGGPLLEDTDLRCSNQFDPVGDDAVSDGDQIDEPFFAARLRIVDYGNARSSTENIPVATVDPTSVELFIFPAGVEPLLVRDENDVNTPGKCQINSALTPATAPQSSDEVAVYALAEVATDQPGTVIGGSAPFVGESVGMIRNIRSETFAVSLEFGDFVDREGPNPDIVCTSESGNDLPEALCPYSPLTRVIQTEFGGISQIYAVPPLDYPQCSGNAIDPAAIYMTDGWICLAARGSDRLGNEAVSPAIAICTLSGGCDGEVAPVCDDGCTALDFPQNELLRIGFE